MNQFLIDLVAAPIIACLWWIFSRGWAAGVQSGQVSDRTKTRQKAGFFIVLALLYVGMFGMTIYKNLMK
jgi:hypothetical protein